jgi:hypothetical protein
VIDYRKPEFAPLKAELWLGPCFHRCETASIAMLEMAASVRYIPMASWKMRAWVT